MSRQTERAQQRHLAKIMRAEDRLAARKEVRRAKNLSKLPAKMVAYPAVKGHARFVSKGKDWRAIQVANSKSSSGRTGAIGSMANAVLAGIR
jgi:hypothetical protein